MYHKQKQNQQTCPQSLAQQQKIILLQQNLFFSKIRE